MRKLTHLNSLQAVDAAIRHGSIHSAASELGISPAAVGQRIKTLEDYLGVQLITRSRRGIESTKTLNSVIDKLALGFESLSEAAEILHFPDKNVIRIIANSDWANLWLAWRIDAFTKQHPHIQIMIVSDEESEPPPCDLKVSFCSRPELENSVELFRDYLLPVSSIESVERISGLAEHSKLEGFPLLHLDFYHSDPDVIDWKRWVDLYGYRQSGSERGIRYQKIELALRAVKSNAGILICGLSLILDELSDGAVVLPFDVKMGEWTKNAFYLIEPEESNDRAQLATFKNWLLVESAKTRTELQQLID